jgi:cation transport regulator ChaC
MSLESLTTPELQSKLEYLGLYGISMDRAAMINALAYLLARQEPSYGGKKTQEQLALMAQYRSLK